MGFLDDDTTLGTLVFFLLVLPRSQEQAVHSFILFSLRPSQNVTFKALMVILNASY